jgi:hypothetical protein
MESLDLYAQEPCIYLYISLFTFLEENFLFLLFLSELV